MFDMKVTPLFLLLVNSNSARTALTAAQLG